MALEKDAIADYFTTSTVSILPTGSPKKMWVRIRALAMGYLTVHRSQREIKLMLLSELLYDRILHVSWAYLLGRRLCRARMSEARTRHSSPYRKKGVFWRGD